MNEGAEGNYHEDPEMDRTLMLEIHVPYYGREANEDSVLRSTLRSLYYGLGARLEVWQLLDRRVTDPEGGILEVKMRMLLPPFDAVVDDGHEPPGYVPLRVDTNVYRERESSDQGHARGQKRPGEAPAASKREPVADERREEREWRQEREGNWTPPFEERG